MRQAASSRAGGARPCGRARSSRTAWMARPGFRSAPVRSLIEEVAEVDIARRLGGQLADRLAAWRRSGAANRWMVPCRTWSRLRRSGVPSSAAPARSVPEPGSAASHRPRTPPRSPAAPVQAHHVADLVDQQRVGRDLEGLGPPRLQPNACQMRCRWPARSPPGGPAPAWTSG